MRLITVMTHMDADGLISLALFMKHIGGARVRAYFTSPVQLRDTICRSVIGKKTLGELYIFDMAGEHRALFAAAMYDWVVWIDHHRWEPEMKLPHIEMVIDPDAMSAAAVVSKYFGVDSPLVSIANEIDTNSVKSEDAEKLRMTIGAIRWRYSGRELNSRLYSLSREIMNGDLSVLENYSELVSEYEKWVETIKQKVSKEIKVFNVGKIKVAIFETLESIPVYLVSNELENHKDAPFDLIIIMIHRLARNTPITKLEFRTHTNLNVLKIARFYGGGGHIMASGATVNDIVTIPELLRSIEILYS